MKRKNLSLLLAMAMTVTTAMTGLTVNVHAGKQSMKARLTL